MVVEEHYEREIMCQGHKCYKMFTMDKVRSPFSINTPLCLECYESLMLEMVDEFLKKKQNSCDDCKYRMVAVLHGAKFEKRDDGKD